MTNNETFIQCKGLHKFFSQRCILQNINWELETSGIHGLVGKNGVGKSTLLKIMAGLEHPTAGSCEILSRSSHTYLNKERPALVYLDDNHSLPSWLKVGELHELKKASYKDWKNSIYTEFVSAIRLDSSSKISSLSRGQRAILNIAVCLAQQPKVVILDEPTLGLDTHAKHLMLEALLFSDTLSDSCIVYCSNQIEEIERVAQSLNLLHQTNMQHYSDIDNFAKRFTQVSFTRGDNNRPSAPPGCLTILEKESGWELYCIDFDESCHRALIQDGAQNIDLNPIGLQQSLDVLIASDLRNSNREHG